MRPSTTTRSMKVQRDSTRTLRAKETTVARKRARAAKRVYFQTRGK